MRDRTLDIQVVTYRPEPGLLDELLSSLTEAPIPGWSLTLRICENSVDAPLAQAIREQVVARTCGTALAGVDFVPAETNHGFGGGHNLLAQRGTAEFLLLLNQDVVLEPGALAVLLDEAAGDDPSVAAWEMRQIPYEHPKSYDPATGDAPWVSGAAVLFRGAAFRELGGFEPRIFMYGEDVDLSWRLRAKGWRLRYIARAAVQHHTYNYPEEIKRTQVLGGTLTNLLLRARFGTWRDIAHGLMLICGELMVPQAFPGRRRGLLA